MVPNMVVDKDALELIQQKLKELRSDSVIQQQKNDDALSTMGQQINDLIELIKVTHQRIESMDANNIREWDKKDVAANSLP